jgi:hypothetical protein
MAWKRSSVRSRPGPPISRPYFQHANYRSNRKLRIALDNLHPQFRRFPAFPKAGSGPDAVADSASIRAVTTLQRARNADEFSLKEFTRGMDHRVAVSSHVDEGNVRRQIGIGYRPRFRDISAPRIFETGPHSMPHEQVDGRLRSAIHRPLSNIQRSQGMVLRQDVFQRFDQPRCRDRTRDKSNPNRYKRLGWQ